MVMCDILCLSAIILGFQGCITKRDSGKELSLLLLFALSRPCPKKTARCMGTQISCLFLKFNTTL